jgi:hypothetical protein
MARWDAGGFGLDCGLVDCGLVDCGLVDWLTG